MAKSMKASKSSKSTAKSPININPSKVGTLRSALGVNKGAKIPVAKLVKATKSSSPKLAAKAQFALNMNHPGAAKKAAKSSKSK